MDARTQPVATQNSSPMSRLFERTGVVEDANIRGLCEEIQFHIAELMGPNIHALATEPDHFVVAEIEGALSDLQDLLTGEWTPEFTRDLIGIANRLTTNPRMQRLYRDEEKWIEDSHRRVQEENHHQWLMQKEMRRRQRELGAWSSERVGLVAFEQAEDEGELTTNETDFLMRVATLEPAHNEDQTDNSPLERAHNENQIDNSPPRERFWAEYVCYHDTHRPLPGPVVEWDVLHVYLLLPEDPGRRCRVVRRLMDAICKLSKTVARLYFKNPVFWSLRPIESE